MEVEKGGAVTQIFILTGFLKKLTLDNNKTILKLELSTDRRRQRLPGGADCR